jgi:hypothetical protein
MLVPDQSGGVRDSSQPCCSFDFLAVGLLLALQGSLEVLLLLAWVLLPLTGEEALEVVGASFVLSDDLTPLPALANLNSCYFSVKSRSAVSPSIPCCLKELGTV